MANSQLLRTGLALLAAATLFGCGGSSSTPSSGVTPLPPGAQTGAVGIILTDAPDTYWDRALGTITSIELLSDDGNVSLFEGDETIDFLDLESYSEIFWIAEGVPVGNYEKIRLHLSSLELQKLGDEDEVVESVFTKLVANGKIDLNPRGGFTVIGDETLIVQLDLDMKKSLKIVEAGASGIVIVRPVVFVKILGEDPLQRFTRVHGFVRELTDEGFVLCQTRLVSSEGDTEELRHCLDVTLDGDAGIFDPAAMPAGVDAIQPDVELTAIGFLQRLAGESATMSLEDRRIGDIGLLGHVVQIGELGTFSRNPGTATSGVGDDSRFGLDPDTGDLTAALLQQGTKIANMQADFVGQDAIQTGVRGVFEGVPDATETSLLRSSFIVLDLDAPVDVLSGVIQEIDLDTESLVITVEDVGDRCVNAADAAIFRVTETEDSLTSEEIALGDLELDPEQDLLAEAFGTESAETDGCFAARVIFVSEVTE
jgi:hypothetical protein